MPDSSASTGRYRSLFVLARGGMGRIDVGQRRESGFERLVAIKRLHDHLAEDQELVTMLLDEARVAGTIRHANVVSVLDVGRDDEGPFLVMDLVEGQSLAQLLAHAASDGLLPLQVGLRILRQVAAGLHAAHETRDASGEPLRVVHRDVSPHNVLVGYDGVARITDFGIAKALGAGTQTEAGLVKGKLRYMAPEQLTFGPVDRRTDLFALGIVAFEVISGRRPFRGAPDEIARAIVSGETPDLGDECPELPSALVELVFRLLARDPELRPRDAEEVGRVLDAVIAAEVAREGVVEVADYLSAHFTDPRNELSKRIQDAVRSAGRDAPPPATPDEASSSVAIAIEREVATGAAGPEPEPTPALRARPRPWIAMGVVVASALVAATVAVTMSASQGDAVAETPSAAAPREIGVPVDDEGTTASTDEARDPSTGESAAPAAETGEARGAGEGEAGEGSSTIAAEDAPPTDTSERRATRPRGGAARAGEASRPSRRTTGLGAWSWDHGAQ